VAFGFLALYSAGNRSQSSFRPIRAAPRVTFDPSQLLATHAALVDKLSAIAARRRGMAPDDAEEFASWVRLRLCEDDFAMVRAFRGESAIETYLITVVARLSCDWANREWGRWRPSAAAQREGTLAVALERLQHRDGMSLDAAIEAVRTHAVPPDVPTERELRELARRLPRREPLRPLEAGEDVLDSVPASDDAEGRVATAEAVATRARAIDGLSRAVAALPAEEQVVVRLHWWHGLGVAEIARQLGIEQKPLYKKMDRVLAQLRAHLVKDGLTIESVREVIDALG
jgi:RNA polymerase sigma factor for flagellar operon FliA